MAPDLQLILSVSYLELDKLVLHCLSPARLFRVVDLFICAQFSSSVVFLFQNTDTFIPVDKTVAVLIHPDSTFMCLTVWSCLRENEQNLCFQEQTNSKSKMIIQVQLLLWYLENKRWMSCTRQNTIEAL